MLLIVNAASIILVIMVTIRTLFLDLHSERSDNMHILTVHNLFWFRGDSGFNDFPDLGKIVWNTVPAVFTCDHCSFNYFCKILPFCIIKCQSQFSCSLSIFWLYMKNVISMHNRNHLTLCFHLLGFSHCSFKSFKLCHNFIFTILVTNNKLF